MGYACPHRGKGESRLCDREFEAITGWKRHMTRQHGGYDDAQLSSVVSAPAPNAELGRSLFLSEVEGGIPGQDHPQQEKQPSPAGKVAPSASAPEPTKRVPFKSKKLKKFFSSIPQVFLKAKGIEPDDDDKEMIDTATEMLEEMFGVAFEVPEDMWVIRSRWLALLFPFGAVLIIWAKHMLPNFLQAQAEAKEKEKEQELRPSVN
jgi:hypothetical protein